MAPAGAAWMLERRAAAQAAIRRFFAARGYLEVETPLAVPSPGLDLHLDAFALEGTVPARFLGTSPEYQMKRMLCAGLPRIFQLARCFRRGELGAWHEPEFTMLEWYRAGASVAALIDETETLVRAIVTEIGDAERTVASRHVDVSLRFEQLTVRQAFERFAGVSGAETLRLARDDEEQFFRLLVDRIEPALASFEHGVFLTEYPSSQASLARAKPGDPDVCERFELYLAGIELCNGFGELTDPIEQRRRFEQNQADRGVQGKPVYPIDERFLAALEQGMPPAAGNALGFDRLLAIALEAPGIAEVMSFPQRDL